MGLLDLDFHSRKKNKTILDPILVFYSWFWQIRAGATLLWLESKQCVLLYLMCGCRPQSPVSSERPVFCSVSEVPVQLSGSWLFRQLRMRDGGGGLVNPYEHQSGWTLCSHITALLFWYLCPLLTQRTQKGVLQSMPLSLLIPLVQVYQTLIS